MNDASSPPAQEIDLKASSYSDPAIHIHARSAGHACFDSLAPVTGKQDAEIGSKQLSFVLKFEVVVPICAIGNHDLGGRFGVCCQHYFARS
jgi:hypothetical protein